MSIEMLNLLEITCSCVQLGLACLCAFVMFRRREYPFAAAGAYAAAVSLMGITAWFRMVHLLGIGEGALVLELFAAAGAAAYSWRHRNVIFAASVPPRDLIGAHSVSALFMCLGGGYLLLQALILPPTPGQWEILAPVIWLQNGFDGAIALAVGDDFLRGQGLAAELFLRRGTDAGLGLIGLTAYMGICLATYALARRYAWPPTAYVVTLVVASMPRLVVLSAWAGGEIVVAAVAVVGILAVYRLVEQPGAGDVGVLLICIGYLADTPLPGYFFAVILSLLAAVLLIRRHGAVPLGNFVAHHRWPLVGAAVTAALLSPLGRMAYRITANISGDAGTSVAGFALNEQPLQGAAANLVRYLLESADITAPVVHACQQICGLRVHSLLERIHALGSSALLGHHGAAAPFEIVWLPDEVRAWFGPLGLLLVVPALGYALIRGPRRLKATALSIGGYAYLVCLTLAWQPGNARYFTLFFACGGFCMAFLLPPWRLSETGKRGLRLISLLLFAYASLGYVQRPIIGFQELVALDTKRPLFQRLQSAVAKSVWVTTNWGRDRLAVAQTVFGDHRVSDALAHLPPGAHVGLVFNTLAQTYPYLLARPDIRFGSGAAFVPLTSPSSTPPPTPSAGWEDDGDPRPGYLLVIDTQGMLGQGLVQLWSTPPSDHAGGSALYRLE